MGTIIIANLINILLWVVYMLNVPRMLHIAQLESYQNDGIFRWLIKNYKQAFKKGAIQLLITAITHLLMITVIFMLKEKISPDALLFAYLIGVYVVMLAFIISNVVIYIGDRKERKNTKKPLKYTSRAIRLMVSNFCVFVLLQVLFMDTIGDSYIMFEPLVFSFLTFTMPVNMILANWFVSPTEMWVKDRYINKARKVLNSKEHRDLIKIGITGSYGKTSTKFILKTILSEKYNVYATPGSYNTTMGNIKVIREELKPEHQVFISEMGARKRYDIQEICQFVNPQIGIITSIGPQHLETFKKIENVAKTKGELLRGITYDGTIFLPKDNSHCLELYNKDKHNKYLYSTKKDGSDVYAENIKVNSTGSTFTAVTKDGKIECKTKLLGEHNVQNIIGCIAIAKHLGLSNEQIQRGVEKIEPVEHRLQLIPGANGTTIIDDAFNSNPVGSKMALEVLKQFEGRKIIITPGMVELGTEEYNLNKEFGKQMAKAVDIAILVGMNRSKPIVEGLKEEKFDDMSIYVVNSLEEATNKLGTLTKAGDVILFENDLPDNYNE